MNKVGYMLDHDRDELFFKYNPNLSQDQNEKLKRRFVNILLDNAESTVDKRLSKSCDHNKSHLREALREKQVSKSTAIVDRRIETGILYFNKRYDNEKKQYYALKKQLDQIINDRIQRNKSEPCCNKFKRQKTIKSAQV